MILLLDNYDSFTYNLVDYFHQIGVSCKVYRNTENVHKIFSNKYQGIVLSPGPGTPAEAGCLMDVVNHYYLTHPMLGICLGHQALGEFFGAELVRAKKPMHGKLSKISLKEEVPVFKGLKEGSQVVRYHSLVLTDLPSCFRAIAHSEEGEIMAIQHNELPLTGLQFHPEAVMTEKGLKMLDNWIKLNHLFD